MLFENFLTATTSSISIQNIIEEAHHSVIHNDTNESNNFTHKNGTQQIMPYIIYTLRCVYYAGTFYCYMFNFWLI